MTADTPGNQSNYDIHALLQRLADTESQLQALLSSQAAASDPSNDPAAANYSTQPGMLVSEAHYRRLVERVPAIIFELEPDGSVLFVNAAVTQITGYDPQELSGCNWWEMFFPGKLRRKVEALKARLRRGDVHHYELALSTKDGAQRTLELNTTNDYSPSGSLERIVGLGVDITRRKSGQAELLHNLDELQFMEDELRLQNQELIAAQQKAIQDRQRYQDLFEFAPDGYLVTDANGTIQEANQAAGRMLKVHPGRLVGKSLAVFVLERERQTFYEQLNRLRVEDTPASWEITLQSGDGEPLPLALTVAGVAGEAAKQRPAGIAVYPKNPVSRPTALRWLLRDISRRRAREAQLAYQADLLDKVNDAIIASDAHFVFTAWNKAAEKIYGWKAEEVLGKRGDRQRRTEITEGEWQHVLGVLATEGAYSGEFIQYRKDGQKIHVGMRIIALKDANGQVTGYLSVNRDITARRRVEAALREKDRLIQTAVSATPVVLFVLDREGVFTLSLGKSAASQHLNRDLTGLSIFDVYRENPRVLENFQRALQGETANNTIEAFDRIFEASFAPLYGENGHIDGVIGASFDITERIKAQQELQKSEERFRAIFEHSGIGINLTDLQGRFLTSNLAFQEMLGYSGAELAQMNFADLTHPDDRELNLRLFDSLVAHREDNFRLEKRYLHKDGRVVWALLTATIVGDEQGRPQFMIAMVENISDQKQMETELAEVQRRLMDSAEAERLLLAQELHDGPVQDLYGLAYRIEGLRDVLPDPASLANLDGIQEALRGVVQSLRSTAGELRPPTLTPFGLEKAIRSHAARFRTENPQYTLHLELSPDGQRLPERTRLAFYRVYQHSLANIVRHAQATHIDVRFLMDAEQAVLEVQDNGRGFEVPERWITFARDGHLGLAGATERAEAIGASLQVESSPGKGTLVRVTLPFPLE